ncbi:MAG: ATP-binding protein [Planctomycetaceae bacterium]|jgi:energy-coupling factor transporter ATP-binding protein EcfA2|nr:ATP-binding protein [Planctomycetaceae bacterium]
MTRSDTINTIIANRKPIAEKTAKTIEHLEQIREMLRLCSNMLHRAMQKTSDEQKIVLQERNTEIDRFVNNLIPVRIRELDQLQRRFSRPTLNIGVVGNAGQGKSTLLQRLTGLADEEIPTGAKGDCTGAAAIIENTDTNEAYAFIEFYSETEFLECVVAPYYKLLNLSPPFNLSAFSQPLPNEVKTTENIDIVNFVERLQQGLNEYKPYFGESQKRIKKSEIRTYTAKSDADGNHLSIWAAVKSARVHCCFPFLKDEKISVGDTPGLGDRAVLEAEERLMRDFGQSIDAVIMLRKVRERGIRKEDVRLFSLVKSAIQELPPEKWSYFMVNVFASDRQTQSTVEALKFLPEDFRNSSLKDMQEYIELDCSDKEAVEKEFTRILDGIANTQGILDKTLYSKRFIEVQKLLAGVTELTSKLSEVFPKQSGGVSSADAVLAQSLFKEKIWDNFSSKLFESVEKWRDEQDTPNEVFLQKLSQIESDLKTVPNLPTKEAMQKKKGIGLNAAFPVFCQDVRRSVLKHFDSLDEALHKIFDDLRVEAKECFTAEDGGKMTSIVLTQEDATKKTWWDSLAEQFETLGATDREQENARRIAEAIRQFDTATLSFRGSLLPRVLPCFNTLNADREEHRPFAFDNNKDFPELIERIQKAAEHGIGKAIRILRDCATEPSIALFATLDDLHDAMVHTGTADVARDLWSYFYADHRSEIWQEQFQQKEADSKFRKDWQDTIDRTNDAVRRSAEIS